MGRFPGETKLPLAVWAVLDLFFSHASNGGDALRSSPTADLHRMKNDKPTQRDPRGGATAASTTSGNLTVRGR